MRVLLRECTWPAEAFWRAFELPMVRRPGLIEPPVLEVGCGDGGFPELAGLHIDEAIDLNPRAVERARARTHVYGTVRCQDLHDLSRERSGEYGTVFANSVLEHVVGLEEVLPLCAQLLRPGGRLVTTVPLSNMNDHLLLSSPWYARWRARQLQHRNLWTLEQWRENLLQAGFSAVDSEPYLDGASCRRWDRMDALASGGIGRYRVAVALRLIADHALPAAWRIWVEGWLLDSLERRYAAAPEHPRDPCAALIVASKR